MLYPSGTGQSKLLKQKELQIQKIVTIKIIKNFKEEYIKLFVCFFIINSFYVMQEGLRYLLVLEAFLI